MKNKFSKRHSWRTLICVLLIAALVMMGAVAEDDLALEVNLEVAMNESDLNVTVGGKAVSDNTGIAVELDGEVVPIEDAPVSGALELDGLNLSDGFGAEPTQAGDATEENAGFAATNSAPEDFEIDGNGVLVKYVGPGGDVVIPDGVTSIGEEAFSVCENLTSVTIPDSVTSIGSEAFLFCKSLTSVTIPKSVTYIAPAAFSCCSGLEAINVSGDNPEYTSENGILYTRDMKILWQCPGAKTSVNIPNGVTYIGDYAFEWCENMTSVTIPDSVTSIGWMAFAYCFSLKNVVIPNGVTNIVSGTFHNCIKLESVTIPNSVTSIERQAFWNCHSLKNLTIPNSVTSIGEYAFRLCESLTSVTIPNSVTRIGDFAFVHCPALTSVTIPKSVTSLGEGAFAECDKMKSAVIEEGDLKKINQFTFAGCDSLTSLTIPDNVIEIEKNIFDLGVDVVCDGVTSSKGGMLDVTIYGTSGSYAETFAKENGLVFVDLNAPTTAPTVEPTTAPTVEPTTAPTVEPTVEPTTAPTVEPTTAPTVEPTVAPTEVPVKVALNKTKATVVAGAKLRLTPKLYPKTAKTTLKWTSSNAKVATVTQKGVVKALKKGTAVITVETANGKKATCKITVPTAPTKVAFAKKSYSVKVGKTVKLAAKLTPTKARTTLTWTTSDKKVATVSKKGVVKGIKKGTATITVKTANGKKASVKVVVK